jgi:RNA polymerase sigma-70 factor (ECF subfamily)
MPFGSSVIPQTAVGTAAKAAAQPTNPEAEELKRLMEAYQQADKDAASELFRRISPMLLRFLAGPISTRPLAEDMLQECWMRLHKARHTYRPGSPVLPWVYAIARHTRVDTYRRRRNIDQRELIPENLESVGGSTAADQDNERADLWALVAQLPESQQEVVRMLKVVGLSLEETARATGSTVGAVKQKAHRAYGKLRTLIENSPGGRPR